MFILQIALGIVLSVIILRYWHEIIAIGLFGGALLLAIGIMILLAALVYNYLWYVVAGLCVIFLMWMNDRMIEKEAKQHTIQMRRKLGYDQNSNHIKDPESESESGASRSGL